MAPERLGVRKALLAAPLRVEAEVPRIALGRAAGETVPVAGTVEGRISIAGIAREPEATAELLGAGVSIDGRPLGDVRVSGKYARRRAEVEVALRPQTGGGTLRGTLAVAADLGVGAEGPPLRDAPAEASAVAEALDLGFVPALAPGLVRTAGGQLTVDVRAKGPLARMTPRGALHVEKGRLAIAELGEWTDVALDARVTEDAVELTRLDLRRGPGKLSASGAIRGLSGERARVDAKVQASAFGVTRAGMELANFDVSADATGTFTARELALEVHVPHGVVRLPKKTPRTLQPLESRKDIVVGRRPEPRKPARGVPAAAAAVAGTAAGEAMAGDRFTFRAHVLVPRDLFVKGESPKVDVELRADVRYELTGDQDYAEGTIEVVRGSVEPIAGRTFSLDRGRVQFTGGPPKAALLDVEAKYTNPAAVVTVNVAGPMVAPEIRLSSQPPMDDSQIAMLIATGRTELKAGSGGVGTLTGEEAGKAALGALATRAFRNLVQDKLPLDTVALDSGALRAGKYVTDKIYFAYVRRFDADPAKYENEDEARIEYQITPRWMFESRYGTRRLGRREPHLVARLLGRGGVRARAPELPGDEGGEHEPQHGPHDVRRVPEPVAEGRLPGARAHLEGEVEVEDGDRREDEEEGERRRGERSREEAVERVLRRPDLVRRDPDDERERRREPRGAWTVATTGGDERRERAEPRGEQERAGREDLEERARDAERVPDRVLRAAPGVEADEPAPVVEVGEGDRKVHREEDGGERREEAREPRARRRGEEERDRGRNERRRKQLGRDPERRERAARPGPRGGEGEDGRGEEGDGEEVPVEPGVVDEGGRRAEPPRRGPGRTPERDERPPEAQREEEVGPREVGERARGPAGSEGRQPQREAEEDRVLDAVLEVRRRPAAAEVPVAVERDHVRVAVVLERPEPVAGARVRRAARDVQVAGRQPQEREGDRQRGDAAVVHGAPT